MILEIIGLLLLLATLPGTVELALLTLGAILPKKKGKTSFETSDQPNIAVLVPAHNEETGIVRTLRSLQACPDPYKLLVIADNCTDRTVPLVKALGIPLLERNQPDQRGKHYALKYAFEYLLKENVDLFVVVDADAIVGPNLIEAISNAYKKGAQAIQVRYALERPYETLKNRLLNVAFSAFNFLRPRGRQRMGFSAGILGNGFAVSRSLLQKVPFEETSVVEDLSYHLQLVKHRCKVHFIETTAVYAKTPQDKTSFDIQRVRWEGGRLKLLKEQAWPLFKGIMQGNGLLIEPLLDLLLLPLGYHVLLLFLMLLVPMGIAKSFAIFGIIILVLHTVVAIKLIKGGWKDYLALLLSPLYIIEKIGRMGKIFNGMTKGDWKRTPRD